MSTRRGWLLLVLAVSAFLALGALVRVSLFIREGYKVQGDKYAVYIDGGSSGTRVRVFRYRPARWPAYVSLVLPEPSMAVEPGLSAYALEPEKAAGSLVPLLEFAYQQIPPQYWMRTPVRLLATAGLRLLTDEQQAAILAACQGALAASKFLFEPAWAAVIDGEMEGLYGWAAVNYITGALQEAAGHAHHSRKEVLDPAQLFTGLLEMGGASMQVTFLPPATVRLPERHGTHLHLPGVPARLFAHSYLGLGMDAALARAVEHVLQEQQQQARASLIADPCLPIGYISDDGRQGNASFAQCLAVVTQILPTHNCTSSATPAASGTGRSTLATAASSPSSGAADDGYGDEAHPSPAEAGTPPAGGSGDGAGGRAASGGGGCTLQDIFVPALAGHFVAVENFAWTARALGLPERATLRQLREHGQRYCSRHWSSLHAEFSGHIPDQFLVRYCFGAAYILALLHGGLGLGMDDSRLHWTNTVREGGDGVEVGVNWVLGAAVVDAMNGSALGAAGTGAVSGGAGHGEQGAASRTGTETQRFWLHDEHGMGSAGATGMGAGRTVLVLPLLGLATLAVFIVVVLVRAARRGSRAGTGGRPVGVSMGAGGTGTGGSLGKGTGEEVYGTGRWHAGEVGRLGAAATAWSSSSLVSESGTAGPRVGLGLPGERGTLDPGFGVARTSVLAGGSAVVGGSVGVGAVPGMEQSAGMPASSLGSAQEGGMFSARHGGVLKAAMSLGTTMRRTSSFTSVFVGAEGSPAGQQ